VQHALARWTKTLARPNLSSDRGTEGYGDEHEQQTSVGNVDVEVLLSSRAPEPAVELG
jgi:hypothetical protein